MTCELCKTDQRISGKSLCKSCGEMIARLVAIEAERQSILFVAAAKAAVGHKLAAKA